ncbi:MAG: S8 family serine peptidase [Chloroflexi bacterium]|nr:S8 family serine peptidase [Chloroflexota bacterium]
MAQVCSPTLPGELVWPTIRRFLRVPEHLTGRGVCIALVDGSFTSHPDVASNQTRTTFLVNTAESRPRPQRLEPTPGPDWFGGAAHGTWAAAAAAGSGALADGVYTGVAPEADLFLVAGWAPGRPHATAEEDRVASLEWVRRHHREYGIRAVLTSHMNRISPLLPWQLDPQRRVAEALAAEGVLVVAGTGNMVDATCGVSLAMAPSALAVGGVMIPEHRAHRKLAFSPDDSPQPAATGAIDGIDGIDGGDDFERAAPYHGCHGTLFEGKWVPQVLAPAENLVLPYLSLRAEKLRAHFYAEVDAHVVPMGYARTEGASFSGPVVLGAAACVWQAHPEWQAEQVMAALVQTAIHRPQWAALRAGLISIPDAIAATPAPFDEERHTYPHARWQAWRQRPVGVRLRAVRAVQEGDVEAGLQALLSFLPEPAPDEAPESARGLVTHDDFRLRTAALCVLATQPAALSGALLLQGLHDTDPQVRTAALHALARRPDLWGDLTPALADAVNDPHVDVRYQALRLALDVHNSRLVPALIAGLDDDLRLGTLNFFARCRALTAITEVEIPQQPPWTFGECHYSERRRQARQDMAAAWRDWLAVRP